MSEYFNVIDPRDVEPYFSRHILAMSVENLYAKGDIAIELAVRDAEIERLRRENAEAAVANIATTKAAVRQYQAEIERLRKALASSCDDQRELFREEANWPCESAMENERLRGLLQEVWNWAIGGPTGVSSDLFDRVREALGDASSERD